MTAHAIRRLDTEALAVFANKGLHGGRGLPLGAGEANAARVRRVIQVTSDLAKAPMNQIRILDLGCGEGVFAIEAALRGSEVVALDARTARMQQGQEIARRLGLENLRFEQADIREVGVSSQGQFDVIYLMGILYHLDIEDSFSVLRNAYGMCRHFILIDTSVAEFEAVEVAHAGGVSAGLRIREHEDADSDVLRRDRPLASIDNTFSFLFTKSSLCRALKDVGFTSVLECHVPFEPTKPRSRVTLIAVKGEPAEISTYPWINEKSETEISDFLSAYDEKLRLSRPADPEPHEQRRKYGVKDVAKGLLNGVLRPFRLEIRRRQER